MKRQFYFTPEERDLLRSALEIWDWQLANERGPYMTTWQWKAGMFTSRRIREMLQLLAEPETA